MKTSMLKLCAAAALFACTTSTGFAQDATGATDELKLDDLYAPENPAYAALGVSPTDVLKPTSPRAFAVSLYENGIDKDGGLVSDFAMQFTPFWWADHPNLTWDAYNGYDSRTKTYTTPHLYDVMQQSLSFALASSQATVQNGGTATDGRLLSASASFDLLRGRPSQKLIASRDRLATFDTGDANDYITIIDSLAATRPMEAQALFPGVAIDQMSLQDWAGACQNSQAAICQAYNQQTALGAGHAALVAAVNENANERVGHRLQFNSAFVFFTPDSSFDDLELARSSYWLSYSYVRDKGVIEGSSPLKVVGLLKYNRTDESLEQYLPAATLDKSAYDVGARIIWESKAYPLNASLEYIHRVSDDNTDSERFTALVDYRINDNVGVVFSVGQALESDVVPVLTGKDTLVSLGLKLNTSALTAGAR